MIATTRAGVPHQILDFEGVGEYFVMTLPLVWFLQWCLPEQFAQAVLHGEAITEPNEAVLASDRARFELWRADVETGSEDHRRVGLLEVEARLRRLALSVASDLPLRTPRHPPVVEQQQLSRAEAMAWFIARNYQEPLTAEVVGQHVGLHPNYAMALLQQTFGATLVQLVTEHRLSHAQRLLVTTADPILDIAFDAGFGSLSRFNEAFRRSFGCTPREYRRHHR